MVVSLISNWTNDRISDIEDNINAFVLFSIENGEFTHSTLER